MRVAFFAAPGKAHHSRWGAAFLKGLSKHGIYASLQSINDDIECDVAVMWSHKHRALIERQKARGGDYLVMEAGYFGDRLGFASVGWNGLNGRADFKNQDMPGDRWEKHGVDIKPWHNGEYILVAGQVQGDAAVNGIDLKRRYTEIINQLKTITNREVVFRPHPYSSPIPDGVTVSHGSLESDLAGAKCLVAINSNTTVDAAIAGTPVVALDEGSMAWPVSAHELEGVLIPRRPDRHQWLNNLAYCQWTENEIRAGHAWEHLIAY